MVVRGWHRIRRIRMSVKQHFFSSFFFSFSCNWGNCTVSSLSELDLAEPKGEYFVLSNLAKGWSEGLGNYLLTKFCKSSPWGKRLILIDCFCLVRVDKFNSVFSDIHGEFVNSFYCVRFLLPYRIPLPCLSGKTLPARVVLLPLPGVE